MTFFAAKSTPAAPPACPDIVAAQQARIADLEATVAELRRRLEPVDAWSFLPLQPMQMRLLSALHAAAPKVAPRAALEFALYGGHARTDGALRMQLVALRAALAPHGVLIANHRLLGWSIPSDGKAKLDALRAAHAAGAPTRAA